MKIILCKNSFESFLSAFYDSYYAHKGADLIRSATSGQDLLSEFYQTTDSMEKANKVKSAIIKKGRYSLFNEVSNAYRSNNQKKEEILFAYLKLFFKHGRSLFNMFALPEVIAFNDMAKKVYFEVHRLQAFIRLKEMSNGIFYGYYSSDNDILDLLIPHFVPRFNSQQFILHDYKRGKLAFYDGEVCRFATLNAKIEIELSDTQLIFDRLWKDYHKNVSIKERANPTLQRAFLPKKYRHFMSEFDDVS